MENFTEERYFKESHKGKKYSDFTKGRIFSEEKR